MSREKKCTEYDFAREQFGRLHVDTEDALLQLHVISLSLHCWQGDDVAGFEDTDAFSKGGIAVTGNYPGKARSATELRLDLEEVYRLLPGHHRLNLHAMYGEFGSETVDRNQIEPAHFEGWSGWARSKGLKIDFNATCFAHPMADSGFTLSSSERDIREFWMEHVRQCRRISSWIGEQQQSPCIHNLWIPDGCKDSPADRWAHRLLLKETLDTLFREGYSEKEMKDSLESKLFGIGSESYVVGSHEFYMGYAMTRHKMLCLDMGHFHPTESVADKISAILQFSGELMLHVSRGVRWDSDHVVIFSDELRTVMEEVVRSERMDSIHIALDFFDATIHRVAAWVIGARSTLKALLWALLQPNHLLRQMEENRAFTQRLALMETVKTMPFGAVWDEYCRRHNTPAETDVMQEIESYEKRVTSKRV